MKNFFVRKIKSLTYSSLVWFIMFCFILFVSYLVYMGQKNYIDVLEDEATYNACYSKQAKIDYALSRYSIHRGGIYPESLKELSPKYFKENIECPNFKKDTFSSSYVLSEDKREFYLYCSGLNHGEIENLPQDISNLSYYNYKLDIYPVKYNYENGNMKKIMNLRVDYRKAFSKKDFKTASEIIENLINIEVSDKANLYVEKAKCMFFLNSPVQAQKALKTSLKYGFDLDKWLTVSDIIDKGHSDFKSYVIEPIRDYVLKINNEDLRANIFAIYLCKDSLSYEDLKKICEKSLKSKDIAHFSAITELMFRGKLAESMSDSKTAKTFFNKIRNFTCGSEISDVLICRISEYELKKY